MRARSLADAALYSGVESLPNRETERATSWFYVDQLEDQLQTAFVTNLEVD